MQNIFILVLFIVTIASFFWGIYKTSKTQKKVYLWYALPFMLLILGMFFI